jgi:predicted dithiol-disulfide oxidoreductase (DUF899 family)
VNLPDVVTEAEWLDARIELLEAEKELTRRRDALSAQRRRLPMVRVERDYRFEGPNGTVTLRDLFAGRRQLIVQHFMFDPDWDEGCPSCTAASDEMSPGLQAHLNARDTSFVVVSRAPLAKLERYRAAKGWEFPWYSSFGSTFNYDYHVTIDASVAPVMFNYLTPPELEARDLGWMLDGSWEQPGYSMFLRDGDDVFHTYATFARGSEALGGSYYFLDLTALGRQEAWEEPQGRSDAARAARPDFAD